MQKLMCEMCGSTDLIEQNDFFECQHCGTRYSIDEIKKIIVERSIESNNHNNENVMNYLNMATNAFNSNNMSESEIYCNKVLEIDNNNYLAWLLKGQLTALKFQIQGAINCFSNSFNNTPEDMLDEIKNNIIIEILNLNYKLITMYCEQYKETLDKFRLDMEVANYIIDTADALKKISIELLLKCGGNEKDLDIRYANTIYNFAINEFIEEYKSYKTLDVKKPIEAMWSSLINAGDASIILIETAIKISNEDISNRVVEYENLIYIEEELIKANFFDYSELVWKCLSEDEEKTRKNKILEWHRKWNEIDSTHIIPSEEELI